jgi:predicted Zn finger-like uncharacterized protein
MHTQCPECQFAFRVTAKLLQQDGGQVRCSSCRSEFNAISFLSEDSPTAGDATAENEQKQTSELLEKLDELAGNHVVHIEDTGMEWQVHDAPPEDDAADRPEMRFDDNTPLPDNFDEPPARPAAEPGGNTQQTPEHPQEYLELGEPDDWQDLLSEVGSGFLDRRGSQAEVPLEVEEELAAIHSELSSRQNGDDATSEHEPQMDFLPEAEDEGASADEEDEENEEETAEKVENDDEDLEEEDLETTGRAATIVAETTISGVPASLLTDAADQFESIVLEGDNISGPGVEDQENEVQLEAQEDSGTTRRVGIFGGRRKTDPPGVAVIGAAILLGLLLTVQIVHANREQLSTNTVFNRAMVPVYHLLGQPLTPQWNIRGWQFQATKGSTDDDGGVLTILSRIANASEKPLPYPLVHVSLTDRWEEIIGSRVLEPGDYLAGDLDPGRPVAAGERFTAIISIESPSPDATGFKLNICYRDSPGRVRCATEDFKH